MHVIHENMALCEACMIFVEGSSENLTPEELTRTQEAYTREISGPGYWLANTSGGTGQEDSTWSTCPCELCRSPLHGPRYSHALLSHEAPPPPVPNLPLEIHVEDPIMGSWVWEYYPGTGYLRRLPGDSLGAWISPGMDHAGLRDHAASCYPRAILGGPF